MTAMMEKASKGQKKALKYLYEKNKKKIFYLAKCLLLEDGGAEDAAAWVFGNLFKDRASWNLETEEEFSDAAVRTLVTHCRKTVLKKDAKAFRIPQNRNFRIADAGTYDRAQDDQDFVLGSLSVLQRFVFALHTLCGYEAGQMTGSLKISVDILSAALEEEKGNVEKLLGAAGKKGAGSYEEFVNDFRKREESASVSRGAEEKVLAVIDEIAGPAERKKKAAAIFAGAVAAACVCIAAYLAFLPRSGQETKEPSEEAAVQGTENAEALDTYADIEIQDYGTVTVKLDAKAAPVTVENFIRLAKDGFYDGLTFHRIMEGFMMQGGDPNGNGSGGSDETIEGEFSENGYDNPLSHVRGAVAMARSSDYNSASSQFYIVHEDSTFLDGSYAVFGNVTEGMEIVDAICEAAEPTDDNGTILSDQQPVITSVSIRTE